MEESSSKPGGRDRPRLDGVIRVAPPAGGPFAAELAESALAYACGDMGRARRLCLRVVEGQHTDAERDFARIILRRTGVDVAAILVGVGSFLLLWLVVYLTVWR